MQQSILARTWDYILDYIYPKECVGCGEEGAWLCYDCREKIIRIKTSYCPFCRRITQNGQFCKNCRRKTALTGIIISAHYREGPLREAIHTYKYEGVRELRNDLAALIIERLKKNLPRGDKIIIPIPLNHKRELARSFNQAGELAEIVSQNLSIPLENKVLERIKETKPQMLLKKKERIENIKDAFRVIDRTKIEGKTVLLIDDVSTTGLTLDAAALVLRQAKAREVWGVVIAQG